MPWESVIGLEVHVQLKTRSKIFSGSSTAYGAAANTQASAVDLALPGVLPVMNRTAALMAVKFGLAIDARINQTSVFARKNYFYPDLPKGYQISQFEIPVVGEGHLDILIDDTEKRIGITRAHLEEDAGKSLHEDFHGQSGIDLNRAGTPLLEIVSEPDLRSPQEAVAYLKKLHSLVRYLDICDGNMQEGSFRCDANVSVRPLGEKKLGTRAELKNINSFRFVERGIAFEIERQIELIESGGRVVQETRLYDPERHETRSMRGKEEAHDYRYFPDPDLPSLFINDEELASIRQSLPELPDTKKQRYLSQLNLGSYDAELLIANPETAVYFENALDQNEGKEAKLIANWINGELSAQLNKTGTTIIDASISAGQLAGLVRRIADNTISGKIAKQVFQAICAGEGSADEIIENKGLRQITDSSAIEKIIDEIIANHPQQVEQYRGGSEKVFGFFVGQVMKASKGKANPRQVNQLLKEKL